jgi:hypothetical protein
MSYVSARRSLHPRLSVFSGSGGIKGSFLPTAYRCDGRPGRQTLDAGSGLEQGLAHVALARDVVAVERRACTVPAGRASKKPGARSSIAASASARPAYPHSERYAFSPEHSESESARAAAGSDQTVPSTVSRAPPTAWAWVSACRRGQARRGRRRERFSSSPQSAPVVKGRAFGGYRAAATRTRKQRPGGGVGPSP